MFVGGEIASSDNMVFELCEKVVPWLGLVLVLDVLKHIKDVSVLVSLTEADGIRYVLILMCCTD